MQKILMVTFVALTCGGPLAMAETTSSQTSTSSTTVANPRGEYSTSKTEQQVDQSGTKIKKSQTYKKSDPITGESSSKSSVSVESPDGSTRTLEKNSTTSETDGSTVEVEKRTSTKTSP